MFAIQSLGGSIASACEADAGRNVDDVAVNGVFFTSMS